MTGCLILVAMAILSVALWAAFGPKENGNQ